MHKLFLYILIFLLSINALAQKTERNLGNENWSFKKIGDKIMFPASIPGTVHTDLFQNKLIPDPFFGNNEKQLQWIENEDWEYESTFQLSKKEITQEFIELQFDGLDTYAKVYLNNTLILEADNMFRSWKIDVKNQLKIGENRLHIIFESAVKRAKQEAKKLPYTLPGEEKVFVRKAQYQFGWDWGPRFVSAGIWKKIKLNFWNTAEISNVKFTQNTLTDSRAILNFSTNVNCKKAGIYHLIINDKKQSYSLRKGQNKLELSYEIKKPKLWWTNGLGNAYLYPFTVSLIEYKQVLDTKKLNVGLRTIELIQEKDVLGTSFYFKLNGIPVFMKGANYIPTDSFLPRVNDSVYENILKNAVAANMNMLRVWGGGVYADDTFYEECDKNGILVWQDFMFACAMYPSDNHFIDNVKKEVIDNVNRLQNHPSIALWCGNNENDEGWKNWGWQKQYGYSEADSTKIETGYKKLFNEVIPQTLDSLLPKEKNIYWPSSPSMGWGKKESLLQGDSHYWGVWWGMEPFDIYKQKVGRFMSEYGFQGMPSRETFKKFANEDELNFTSESVKNHQKHPTGYKTIDTYMERDYKIPTRFEDYIYVSQLLQAKGMKTAIEAHRRAKPYCMGSLFWQLNDCWPVTSWSSVDYYGNWKALQYEVKRCFEPLLISINEEENQYKVYIVSDELKSKKAKLELKLMNFDGKIIWNKTKEVLIEANSSKVYFAIDKTEFPELNPKQNLLFVKLLVPNNKVINSLYYFEKPKDLELKKPTISIRYIDNKTIEIFSNTLSKDVFLYQEDTFFKDNFFDLMPGEKKLIKVIRGNKNTLVVKSLFDVL